MEKLYDLIIIGAGPAGLTASIYASCFHLKHLVIGTVLGGQLQIAPDIINYPGFMEITGKDLTNKLVDQAKTRGGEIVTQSVTAISNIKDQISNIKEEIFIIETLEGSKYQAKSLILATGSERRKLNVKGEAEYTGRGVSYCCTCENHDYDGKICAVVGGGNSAMQGAVELSRVASKIYLIYRGTELRGEKVWLDKISQTPIIEVLYSTAVEEIEGDGQKVIGVKISNIKNQISNIQMINQKVSNETTKQFNTGNLKVDKVFVEIGGVPGSALMIPLGVTIDKNGFIEVNQKLETNIPGVFAAGDLVNSELSLEQIATSVGLGARAAASAFAFIRQGKAPSVWGQSQIRR